MGVKIIEEQKLPKMMIVSIGDKDYTWLLTFFSNEMAYDTRKMHQPHVKCTRLV